MDDQDTYSIYPEAPKNISSELFKNSPGTETVIHKFRVPAGYVIIFPLDKEFEAMVVPRNRSGKPVYGWVRVWVQHSSCKRWSIPTGTRILVAEFMSPHSITEAPEQRLFIREHEAHPGDIILTTLETPKGPKNLMDLKKSSLEIRVGHTKMEG